MDKTTFMNTLQETRAQWEELLAQVEEERMLQPGATGKWSVKDAIAHVMSGEGERVPLMHSHVGHGPEMWNLSDDVGHGVDNRLNPQLAPRWSARPPSA